MKKKISPFIPLIKTIIETGFIVFAITRVVILKNAIVYLLQNWGLMYAGLTRGDIFNMYLSRAYVEVLLYSIITVIAVICIINLFTTNFHLNDTVYIEKEISHNQINKREKQQKWNKKNILK